MNGVVRKNSGAGFVKGFLIFLVAFLLGIAVTLASIVGGIYAALSFVTIDTLEGLGIHFADSFLEEDSELRTLSIIGLVGEVMTLSGQLSETTFNSLIERYGVIVSDEARDYIPDGLVDLPFSELAGGNAAHAVLSRVTFGDVFKISGEFVPEAMADKITSRTLDLAVEKKFDMLLDGVYLGDAINVPLVVREDGSVVPDVDEPRLVDHFGTLDLGEFFAAEDTAAKDAVLNKTLGRIPLADLMAEEDGIFGSSISKKSLGEVLIVKDLSFLFSMEPLLDGIYLGHVLGYHEVYDTDGTTILYWADKNDNPAKGIYRELVDVLVKDLDDTDIMEKIDKVYVAELMDYEREEIVDPETGEVSYRFYKIVDGKRVEPSGMTKDLAVMTVGELRQEDTLNAEIRSMQLGVVMDYQQDEEGVWRDAEGNPAKGTLRPLLGSTVGSLDKDMKRLYLGQIMGFDLLKNEAGKVVDKDDNVIEDEEGNITGIPVFIKDGNNDGKLDDATHDTPPGALMAAFVDMKLSEIDDEDEFTKRVNNVRVGDAMGYVEKDGTWYEKKKDGDGNLVYEEENRVKGMFQTLAGSKVNELEGAVQDLTLADALGYTYDENDEQWEKDSVAASGIFRILMEKGSKIDEISDHSKDICLGEIMEYEKTTDENGDIVFKKDGKPASGVIASFVDLTVGQLEDDSAIKTKIDAMAVGTAMGYTYNEETDTWTDGKGDAPTGFMKLIDPETPISGLDEKIKKLTTAEGGSIQKFMDAGILEIDTTMQENLDKLSDPGEPFEGWRDKSISAFVNALLSFVPSTGS